MMMDFNDESENKIKIEFIEPSIASTFDEEKPPIGRTSIVTETDFKSTEGFTFQSDIEFRETRPIAAKPEPNLGSPSNVPQCESQTTDNGATSMCHRDCGREEWRRRDKCSKIFGNLGGESTNRRMMFNIDLRPYECDVCGYTTNHKQHLKWHLMRHADVRTLACEQCPKRFYVQSELINHLRVHSGEKPYICDICSRGFAIRSNLVEHIRWHTRKSNAKPLPTYECYVCGDGVRYTRKIYLENHMRLLHFGGGAMHSCTVCSDRFWFEKQLNKHMTVHNDETAPDLPGKNTITTTSQTTTTVKLFKCSHCEYSTKYNSHLKVHARKHSGERPYKCGMCPAAFSGTSHLRRHQRALHAVPHLKCNECSKKFSELGELNLHVQTKHRGLNKPKNFECRICSLRATSKSNLEKHLRTHTGEKPFECSNCSKAFGQQNNLDRHVRDVVCKRTYECNICSKTFRQQNFLKNHLRMHKNGECSITVPSKRLTRKLQCFHCTFTASFDHSLTDHIKKIHAISMDCSLRIRKI